MNWFSIILATSVYGLGYRAIAGSDLAKTTFRMSFAWAPEMVFTFRPVALYWPLALPLLGLKSLYPKSLTREYRLAKARAEVDLMMSYLYPESPSSLEGARPGPYLTYAQQSSDYPQDAPLMLPSNLDPLHPSSSKAVEKLRAETLVTIQSVDGHHSVSYWPVDDLDEGETVCGHKWKVTNVDFSNFTSSNVKVKCKFCYNVERKLKLAEEKLEQARALGISPAIDPPRLKIGISPIDRKRKV